MIDDLELARENRERVKVWQNVPYPEYRVARQGSGRLGAGEGGHFKFHPDTGCLESRSCLHCPLPECRLVVLDKGLDK